MKIIFIILLLISTFSVKSQVWEVVGEMPHPVYGGEAVVKDSFIYIIGGYSNILNRNVSFIQAYNPQDNSWQIIDSMNASRYGFIAGRYQDSIIFTSGILPDSLFDSSLEIWNLNNSPYIYDFSSDFLRTFATGLVYNDILYSFGGISLTLFASYMYEYNIPESTIVFQNNFDFIAAFPFQQMSEVSGNSIFLFGGVFIGTSRRIYLYDLSGRTFDLLSVELIKARAGGKAVSVSDSMIIIIGGLNETEPSISGTEIFLIDNENYNISPGPELNIARSELMAVKYNNSIYVFGGKGNNELPVSQYERLSYTTRIEDNYTHVVNDFILFQNYPNPFNPTTYISWQSPVRSHISLKVYDILGKEISVLVNEEKPAGYHKVGLDASLFSSGIYIYKLAAFNFSTQKTYIETRKMILLK